MLFSVRTRDMLSQACLRGSFRSWAEKLVYCWIMPVLCSEKTNEAHAYVANRLGTSRLEPARV